MILAEKLLIYSTLSCLLVLLTYAMLIYFFTMPFVWFSILSTGVAICGISHMLNLYVDQTYQMDKLDHYYTELHKEEPNWSAVALKSSVGILYFFAFIYLCCVCRYFKDIRTSVGVLSTSSTIVFKNIYVILVPFFAGILLLAWLAFWATSFILLLSTGNIT